MLSQITRNIRKVNFTQVASTFNKTSYRNQSDFALNEEFDNAIKDFKNEMYINKVLFALLI